MSIRQRVIHWGQRCMLPLCGPLWTATRADEKAASVTLLLIWEGEEKCVCVTLSSLSKHRIYMFLLFFCCFFASKYSLKHLEHEEEVDILFLTAQQIKAGELACIPAIIWVL